MPAMIDPQAPPPTPPEPPPFTWGALLFVVFSLLLAVAYLYWMTAIEGWRVWVVVGLIALTAACAGLAHWAMERTRR